MDPTKAADSLDAVGDDVISALLWVDSEERGLRSVSHKLCECGAADMHRPPLALFRGERSADCCVCGQLCQEGERKRGREGEREKRDGEGERESLRGTGGGKSERERERRKR